ncbi:hypothetical protein EW146_g9963 [Bondarzewia mesenterica]|uniref:Uncharacterized protein n=1 Tax=Bondarzewia mesenterica TaxID=1095465 RepID=A0A4S4L6I3_9AGAM|nr:hypothetical protein EW146_g9963 [Bondarzewia mesenterica]
MLTVRSTIPLTSIASHAPISRSSAATSLPTWPQVVFRPSSSRRVPTSRCRTRQFPPHRTAIANPAHSAAIPGAVHRRLRRTRASKGQRGHQQKCPSLIPLRPNESQSPAFPFAMTFIPSTTKPLRNSPHSPPPASRTSPATSTMSSPAVTRNSRTRSSSSTRHPVAPLTSLVPLQGTLFVHGVPGIHGWRRVRRGLSRDPRLVRVAFCQFFLLNTSLGAYAGAEIIRIALTRLPLTGRGWARRVLPCTSAECNPSCTSARSRGDPRVKNRVVSLCREGMNMDSEEVLVLVDTLFVAPMPFMHSASVLAVMHESN